MAEEARACSVRKGGMWEPLKEEGVDEGMADESMAGRGFEKEELGRARGRTRGMGKGPKLQVCWVAVLLRCR